MKYILVILFSFFVLTACSSQDNNESETKGLVHKTVSKEEFGKVLNNEDIQLLDVRTPAEFSEGNIEGSINIDINNPSFTEKITDLDKSKPTLVYCRMGGRSAKAMEVLKESGFEYVLDLDGGYTNWTK